MKTQIRPIIFFDGVCSVCNYFVDFILKRDSGAFRFASLQGLTAKEKLDQELVGREFKSLALWDEDGTRIKSRAVLEICSRLGWKWRWIGFFKLFPSKLLDFFYDYFAAHRYQWFGKHETCRIPTPEERSRFLD
jgi:predicted DCC family thiol-disulfide oxidoreductase YuxK